jgi:hypothetical protein
MSSWRKLEDACDFQTNADSSAVVTLKQDQSPFDAVVDCQELIYLNLEAVV